VGTVHIALARRVAREQKSPCRRGSDSRKEVCLPGDRTTIRDRSVKAALQMLRFALLDVDDGHLLLWERPETDVRNQVKRNAPDPLTPTSRWDRTSAIALHCSMAR
jgi:hypothetical protein